MGNIITRDTNDTIHWNSIKTENFSGGNDNSYTTMSNDSQLLLNRLELNIQKGGGDSEEISDIDNIFSKPIFNNVNISKPLVGGGSLLNQLGGMSETENKEIAKNDLSDTSPFISSEMYNLLMKNNDEIQKGGSIQKGGKIEGDDSSTSSTSSSGDSADDSDDSSSEESEKKKKQQKKGKKNLKGGNKSKKVLSESSNSNELSYISSSAHTEKSDEHSVSPSVSASVSASSNKSSKKSNSAENYESSSDSYVTSEKSSEKSTIQNLNNNLPNSSINTSDINMITE